MALKKDAASCIQDHLAVVTPRFSRTLTNPVTRIGSSSTTIEGPLMDAAAVAAAKGAVMNCPIKAVPGKYCYASTPALSLTGRHVSREASRA